MPNSEEWLNDPTRPKPAPIEYAGKWVAWDKSRQHILAHGITFADALDAARTAGYPDAILQKVPRPDVFIVG